MPGWPSAVVEREDGSAEVQVTYPDGSYKWVLVLSWQRPRLSLDTIATMAAGPPPLPLRRTAWPS